MSPTTPGGGMRNRSSATMQTKRNSNNNHQTPIKQSSRSSLPTPTQRSTRRRLQAGVGPAGSIGGAGDAGTSGWLSGNKRSQGRLEKPTIASTMRAASNRKKQMESTRNEAKNAKWDVGGERRKTGSFSERKSITTTGKFEARARLWPQRKPSNKDTSSKSTKKKEAKANDNEASGGEEQTTTADIPKLQELGIQTNEAEILNHDLLIGDIKLMLPSKDLVTQLDKKRSVEGNINEQRKIKLTPTRKLDAFEVRQESHLSELEEFMERNCIKKRLNKEPINTFNQSAILRSMDELLTRDVPRAESITEIRERIRRKENELMQLFDDVDEMDEPKAEPAANKDDDQVV